MDDAVQQETAASRTGTTGRAFDRMVDRFSARVTKIGLIIGAVVTLVVQLNSCANEKLKRYEAFQARVNAEEIYWRTLYAQYAEAMTGPSANDTKQQAVKLQTTLAMVKARRVPTFQEYSFGIFGIPDAAKSVQEDYLSDLKVTLNDLITGPLSGAAVVKDVDAAATADAVRLRNTDDTVAPPPTGQADRIDTSSAPSFSYDAQVLTYGMSTGYDFDIFWCVGHDTVEAATVQQENFNRAWQTAKLLAERADARSGLSGFGIARVRIRPLPVEKQGGAYPSAGQGLIIFHEENDEKPLAEAVKGEVLVRTGYDYRLAKSDSETKWYISLFACQP